MLIAYAYIGRECWLFLTNGRWSQAYTWIYCIMALVGALGSVTFVWSVIDCIVGCLIIVNVGGLLLLLPRLREGVKAYFKEQAET